MQAKDEKRSAPTLYAWNFLIGVQDFTRQGALRFRPVDTEELLDSDKMAAASVTTLRELEPLRISSAAGGSTIWMYCASG